MQIYSGLTAKDRSTLSQKTPLSKECICCIYKVLIISSIHFANNVVYTLIAQHRDGDQIPGIKVQARGDGFLAR